MKNESTLFECPDCRRQVSALAAACPGCGRPLRERQTATGMLSAIALPFAIVAIAGVVIAGAFVLLRLVL